MSDLFGNPDDRFSRDAAHIISKLSGPKDNRLISVEMYLGFDILDYWSNTFLRFKCCDAPVAVCMYVLLNYFHSVLVL